MTHTKDKGRPEEGKQYMLTGATGTPAISNGSTWAEAEVGGKADLSAKFRARVEGFMKVVASLQDVGSDRSGISVTYGRKYAKVMRGGTVYCFIAFNGDVLKAATYNTPAKHARSNIFAEDFGRSGVGEYGANYIIR